MTAPTDQAASAVTSVEWGAWLRSVGGASATAGLTVSQINDWIALCVGVLTAAYTLLKLVEWFEARADRAATRAAREAQTRSLEHLHELWERRAMTRSRPAPLDDDPQEHHRGK